MTKLYFWASIFPIMLSFFIGLTILLISPLLPPKLPLFYSLPWGEEQLTAPLQFFTIPAISILITLLNLTISSNLHSAQLLFKKILIVSSLLSTLILTITFVKIVFIFV